MTGSCHASSIADQVTSTGHNLKWDHFDILARGRSYTHCKTNDTLLIRYLKHTLNANVSSEKLYLYISLHVIEMQFFQFLSFLLLRKSTINYPL